MKQTIHNQKPKIVRKKKVYTDNELYSGRAVKVKYEGRIIKGEVSNGGQCGSTQFAFSGEDGTETCIARKNIISVGR